MNLKISVLFFLYRHGFLRKRALAKIVSLEGGQLYSSTLRDVYAKEYNILIGKYSYGGIFNHNRIASGTEVGRYCSFASTVYVFDKNHPIERISQHPFFYNPKLGFVDSLNINSSKIIIGHDVWIGENVIITPSVNKIGLGAVVAAGSIVTKDVPAFAIVAGNPAKILRYRFSDTKQKEIEDSRWWEMSIDQIKSGKFADFLK